MMATGGRSAALMAQQIYVSSAEIEQEPDGNDLDDDDFPATNAHPNIVNQPAGALPVVMESPPSGNFQSDAQGINDQIANAEGGARNFNWAGQPDGSVDMTVTDPTTGARDNSITINPDGSSTDVSNNPDGSESIANA